METGTQITARVHNKIREGEIIEETEKGYLAEFHCPEGVVAEINSGRFVTVERVRRELTKGDFVRSENYSSGDV